MLRLSKKADYALIAMKHLAQKSPGAQSTSAREIAEHRHSWTAHIERYETLLQELTAQDQSRADSVL